MLLHQQGIRRQSERKKNLLHETWKKFSIEIKPQKEDHKTLTKKIDNWLLINNHDPKRSSSSVRLLHDNVEG